MRLMEEVTTLFDVGIDDQLAPARGIEYSLEEVREFVSDPSDDNFMARLVDAMDTAQGEIQQCNSKVAYVVLRIVKA